mgnify:CR=1 FL=1
MISTRSAIVLFAVGVFCAGIFAIDSLTTIHAQTAPVGAAQPAVSPVVERTSYDAQYGEIAKLPGKTYVLSDIAVEWMDINSGVSPTQSYYKVCIQGTAYFFTQGNGVLTPSYINGNPEKCSTKK